MPRRLFDSEYIFGLHEPGGEHLMINAGKPGWIVFTEEVGRNPNDFSGKDFTPWSSRNLGILCRINHGYAPNGTIPHSTFYADFARRCANFVANSQGCKIWIIGNEMNFAIERPSIFAQSLAPAEIPKEEPSRQSNQPSRAVSALFHPFRTLVQGLLRSISSGMGDAALFAAPEQANEQPQAGIPAEDDPFFHGAPERFNALRPPVLQSASPALAAAQTGEIITPELYVRCYRLCRDAIHRVPGHADDQVLIGAVAPWNNQTTYPGNPNGDWVQYFQDILRLLGPNGCDGITLHTYTHGTDPNLITDPAKMNPPFQQKHYHFLAYRDFMNAIPADMRHLPVYITETDQDDPWLNANNGWVQRAYREIDSWNRRPGAQQIRSLVLYRWPNIDRWVIENKPGVIADFQQALANDYRWREVASPSGAFRQGDLVVTLDVVNLRRTPGHSNKPGDDILQQLPVNSTLTVLSDVSRSVDGLVWWNVRFVLGGNLALEGWIAQTSQTGAALLRKMDAAPPSPLPPPPGTGIAVNDTVRTLTLVNLRRTPGVNNKPANDIVIGLPPDTRATVIGGPRSVDGLVWWSLRAVVGGMNVEGWAAEKAPNGEILLAEVAGGTLPPPPPPSSTGIAVNDTVRTLTQVNLRRTPGVNNKPANDIVIGLPAETRATVIGGPRSVDGLVWWSLRAVVGGMNVEGWAAEKAPNGQTLLAEVTGAAPLPPPPSTGSFAIGELVRTTDLVRVRRTPGINNKPPDDTLGAFEPRTTLNILEGPRSADGLIWWRVAGITLTVGAVRGWVAERAPGGATLVAHPAKLPGTNIPDRATGTYLAAPFQGSFGISQLWGENPQIYNRITYDGVPLKGHNGIDFLTPTGTNVVATADGIVQEAVFNDPSGFGHYVKLGHGWGESIYAHLESIAVQVGQAVVRGHVIGRSGNTGFSSGPHLHFAIRINPYSRTDGWGGFSDPLPYMRPSDIQLPSSLREMPAGIAAAPMAQTEAERLRDLARAPGYAPDQPGVRRP